MPVVGETRGLVVACDEHRVLAIVAPVLAGPRARVLLALLVEDGTLTLGERATTPHLLHDRLDEASGPRGGTLALHNLLVKCLHVGGNLTLGCLRSFSSASLQPVNPHAATTGQGLLLPQVREQGLCEVTVATGEVLVVGEGGESVCQSDACHVNSRITNTM